MKQNYLTLPEDSTEVLRGCFWAVTTSAPFILLILFTWLAFQRAEILYERNWRIGLGRELGIERGQWNTTLATLNQRLAQAEAAQTDAETKAATALDAKDRAEAQFAQVEKEFSSVGAAGSLPVNEGTPQAAVETAAAASAGPVTDPPPATAVPSTDEITEFIKAHLARMMGPASGQLVDYADDTDFHDMPHASLPAIELDRSRWEEKWPRRLIFKDYVTPEVVFNSDPNFGWVATAVFNWRWLFWSRTGETDQGFYRDTWKIVPGAGGMKIISEHSVDATTGRSRD
jgi:hypothetical protein